MATNSVLQFFETADQVILGAMQNPTTLPSVLATIAAISKLVVTGGADVPSYITAIQNIGVINQNLITAQNAATSVVVSATPPPIAS
jgi:hypothetical protein